jgi:hypothetical protein
MLAMLDPQGPASWRGRDRDMLSGQWGFLALLQSGSPLSPPWTKLDPMRAGGPG